MGWFADAVRIAAAIGTGGMSEVALAAYDALGNPLGDTGMTTGYDVITGAFKGPGEGGGRQAARGQADLARMLQAQAAGTGGPTAAEMILKRGQREAMGGALGIARSARGNPLLALRQAQIAQEGLGARASESAAVLRAQEQQGAQGLLANVLAQQRGGAATEEQSRLGVIGSGLQAAATAAPVIAAAASDRRVKRQVGPADREVVDAFLDSISPSLFRYAGEGDAEPRRLGIMAQDAERTSAGRSMVSEGVGGMKQIDVGQGLGAALASLASLRDRIAELEAQIGPARKAA